MKKSYVHVLKRDDMEIVPKASTEICTNDILQLVGDDAALSKMRLIIGHEVDAPTFSYSGEIRAERVVVTNEKVLGKKIRTLGIHQKIWCGDLSLESCWY